MKLVKKQHKPKQVSLKRFFIGMCVGASIPALLGAYELYRMSVVEASLPPGQHLCGNLTLGPMFLIIIGAPVLGSIGAVIAAWLP